MADSRQSWKLDGLLLGVMAALLLLHLFNLPPWVAPIVIGGLLWRALHDWRGLALPNRWLSMLLMAAGVLAVFLGFGNLLGREAGTTLLVIAATLKLLETRRPRDAHALLLLGFFLIVTHFLYNQSPLSFLLMMLALTGLVASLIGLNTAPGTTLSPWRRFRGAGAIIAAGLPATLILFLLFPRPPGALWGVQTPTSAGVTGLSETMEPGQISDLSQSGEVAFRVRFDDAIPPPHVLYWRGPVMWDYDGLTWSRRESGARPAPVEAAMSEEISYTVTLEPNGKHWLFALDIPTRTPPRSRINASLEIQSAMPVENRLRYRMSSALAYLLDPHELSQRDLAAATALPAGANPRLRTLAAGWRGEPPAVVIERALAMFHDEPFSYTLSPGLLPRDNGMDHFLFEAREGFCEHYASAFVLMMRAAGIPARVVTGYLGGEVNNDYLIVRQSDAHAWAEVWIEDDGWVRIDPTAAIAPERIETGVADSVRDTAGLPASVRRDDSWQRQVALRLDRLENNWNQWVLGYSSTEQNRLLERFGMENLSRAGMLIMAIGGAILAWILAFWLIRLWPAAEPGDPLDAAWRRFNRLMRRQGLPRRTGETPRQYQARIARERPELAQTTGRVVTQYIKLAYGKHRTQQALRGLRRELRTLQWQCRREALKRPFGRPPS